MLQCQVEVVETHLMEDHHEVMEFHRLDLAKATEVHLLDLVEVVEVHLVEDHLVKDHLVEDHLMETTRQTKVDPIRKTPTFDELWDRDLNDYLISMNYDVQYDG